MVKNVTPQPASLLLPLLPPAHIHGKRPVNPYIGVLAQKDACMTTKISRLKRRFGGSMAYVITFGRAWLPGDGDQRRGGGRGMNVAIVWVRRPT